MTVHLDTAGNVVTAHDVTHAAMLDVIKPIITAGFIRFPGGGPRAGQTEVKGLERPPGGLVTHGDFQKL